MTDNKHGISRHDGIRGRAMHWHEWTGSTSEAELTSIKQSFCYFQAQTKRLLSCSQPWAAVATYL